MTTSAEGGGTGRRAGAHSYRCPVCGHADDVSLSRNESVRIRCSHCATLLEVALDREREEAAEARVAETGRDVGGPDVE